MLNIDQTISEAV